MRIEIKDIKKGQKFTEQSGGMAATFEAIEDGHRCVEGREDGWQVRGKYLSGDKGMQDENGITTFFVDFSNNAYGPKLYTE